MTTTEVPLVDTQVSYPDGATESTGTVIYVTELADGSHGLVLDQTAFHPVDTAWPDQPSDRGTLHFPDGPQAISHALTGAVQNGQLFVGADVPVRTGTEGWAFVVVHVVADPPPPVGTEVQISVDTLYRRGLSFGHTACHLAALALDVALADAWTKPVGDDPLGNPAFDSLAIQSSSITELHSTDVYRVGKSLRKKGFSVDALADTAAVAARLNEQLAEWLQSDAAVGIERDSHALSARRTWACELPGQRVTLPCGGTHVTRLADFSAISVTLESLEVPGGLELTMSTTAIPR